MTNVLNIAGHYKLHNHIDTSKVFIDSQFYPGFKISLKGVGQFKNLKSLTIIGHEILDIESLSSASNLTKLNLSLNKLYTCDEIGSLINLKNLSLGDNIISDIRPLANLKNLEQLFIPYNIVRLLNPIFELKSLKVLNCAVNKITDIDGIENLQSLEEFYCQHNKIENLHPICGLKNLKRLILDGFSAIKQEQVQGYLDKIRQYNKMLKL